MTIMYASIVTIKCSNTPQNESDFPHRQKYDGVAIPVHLNHDTSGGLLKTDHHRGCAGA